MTTTPPPPVDAWRHNALEPNDMSLLGLAQELVDQHQATLTFWDRPGSRYVHHQTARWALVRHGWWADDQTLARLRAAIRNVENRKDAS